MINAYAHIREVLDQQEVRRTGLVTAVTGNRVRVETEDGALEVMARNRIDAAQGDTVLIEDGAVTEKVDYIYDTQVHYV